MSKKRFLFRPKFLHPFRPAVTHWKDSEEMHVVLHTLPGPFRALMLELLERPMSRDELQEVLRQMGMRMGGRHDDHSRGIHLDDEISRAIELGVLEKLDGKYTLTPGGRELAEHIREVIPLFFEKLLSEKAVSLVNICVHVLLSVVKLAFGVLSSSAGLLADGIDNTADTLSSVLVWFGIKFEKEKFASLFIVVMMYLSLGGVLLASYHKFLHPEPVKEGIATFLLSAFCGVIMLGISAYQYLVGKRHSNFALMCQAVDSRNHVLTSFLVCGGIVLSLLAEKFQLDWLYYADAAVSLFIGFFILQSAIELTRELFKTGDEPADISHFMRSAQEKARKRIVFEWLSKQLHETPLTQQQLEERFVRQFCEQTPKIMQLTGIGYCPESHADLHRHLTQFVKERKVEWTEKGYVMQTPTK